MSDSEFQNWLLYLEIVLEQVSFRSGFLQSLTEDETGTRSTASRTAHLLVRSQAQKARLLEFSRDLGIFSQAGHTFKSQPYGTQRPCLGSTVPDRQTSDQ